MDIFLWCVLGFIILSVLTYFLDIFIKKGEDKLRSIFNDLEEFSADEIYLSVKTGFASDILLGNVVSAVGFDKNNKKICFVNEGKVNVVKMYSFNDIMESEIVIDGNTIVKTSATSAIGRAVVGGVLTGGVGAVIGGVTGKKSHNEVVKKIDLKICVNDSSNPFYKIRFLDTECKKGDYIYNDGYEKAEKWHGIISTFIKQSELKESKKESVSTDINDLLKLKELLDAGLLTNEEFTEQKKKLL
jgi:hypothetical protein